MSICHNVAIRNDFCTVGRLVIFLDVCIFTCTSNGVYIITCWSKIKDHVIFDVYLL